jgi:hypothetical protein
MSNTFKTAEVREDFVISVQSELIELLGDVTSDEEFQAALFELNRDTTAHLTSTVLSRLLESRNVDVIAEALVPHLATCTYCCQMLIQGLDLVGADSGHRARLLLASADSWAKWDQAGRNAASSARAVLTARGIGYVFGRDGKILRRLADGSEEHIADQIDSAQ